MPIQTVKPTSQIVGLLGLLGVLVASPTAAQTTSPVHLVGHEDSALLRRVQDLIDDWDPRKLGNPLVKISEVRLPNGAVEHRQQLRRADLAEFIADVEAAEVLGKAFFWEIQAGSDFRRLSDGRYVGTACASCHYRNGADARSRYTTRIPYVAWNQYKLDPAKPLEFGETQLPFAVKTAAVSEVSFTQPSPYGRLSFTVGSTGVEPRVFAGLNPLCQKDPGGAWEFEASKIRTLQDYSSYGQGFRPEWAMFVENQNDAGARFRQLTARNSPSVINSGFADRLFHDGRAESTFNGFSIFGDRDQRPVLYRGVPLRGADGQVVADPKTGATLFGQPVQAHIALTHAALASQAVGPIVNEVEMSYLGRSFPNVACKLLDAKILPHQTISDDDSVLGPWKKRRLIGADGSYTYRDLIRLAFRREWWDAGKNLAGVEHEVPLVLMGDRPEDQAARGSLLVANFSLYWGLSIMFHEASLVSNHSPFDGMMMGNPKLVEERWTQEKTRLAPIRLDRSPNFNDPEHKTGTAVFQHGFRVFMNRGCIECHSGPLFSELYDRLPEATPFPIHHTMERTLLPTSRSDAIALKRQQFHADVVRRVATIIANGASLDLKKASSWAEQLDLLREPARGDVEELERLVKSRLRAIGLGSKASDVATLLMQFEKTAHRHYGGRLFFTEDERVALAEQLTDPVLVEKMRIPPTKPGEVFSRPPLPILGPVANESYVFYDLAFYALGVSPPRYDRGIGGRTPEPPALEEALGETQREIQRELDGLPESEQGGGQGQELKRQLQQVEGYRSGNRSTREFRQTLDEAKKQPRGGEVVPLDVRLQRTFGRTVREQPNSGASGSAYRFQPQSKRARPLDGPTTRVNPRMCAAGPTYDPDAHDKASLPPTDLTWARNDIPLDGRRSTLIFKSRARTLVSDEEPWGFRKPFLHDNELAFWGAFKTPSLRNVELTAP